MVQDTKLTDRTAQSPVTSAGSYNVAHIEESVKFESRRGSARRCRSPVRQRLNGLGLLLHGSNGGKDESL